MHETRIVVKKIYNYCVVGSWVNTELSLFAFQHDGLFKIQTTFLWQLLIGAATPVVNQIMDLTILNNNGITRLSGRPLLKQTVSCFQIQYLMF